MRVMTWNLWWRFGPWEERRPAIREVLTAQDPDVVLLQEVWADDAGDQARELAAGLGLHAVTGEPVLHDGEGFGNAVLSRWPVNRIADLELPGHDGRPGHRRVVAAVVDTPWGRWPVASTHLDHRFDASATRQMQVRRLLELAVEVRADPLRDLPLVIGGDLNAVPDSEEVRMLTGRRPGVTGIVMSDVWEHVGEGPGPTWRSDNPYTADSAWPDRRLDYLLVSWPRPKPVGNPARAWLAGTEAPRRADAGPDDPPLAVPSDHAAVVADLVTPADP
jgi:endonuclease/exonuclease/phosphatase family metal-dependent hydrolase